MSSITRRRLIQQFLGSAAIGLGLPKSGLQASNPNERQFLFIFCQGGWDQCYLFAPKWDLSGIDMEPNSYLGQVGNIPFVDSQEKPSVRSFLQQYGDRTCFINGIGVRSVAHDTCLRLIYAGTSEDRCNDWASIIASQSVGQPILPQVILSGPSYASDLSEYTARVGESAQLAGLLGNDRYRNDEIDIQEDAWLAQLSQVQESKNIHEMALVEKARIAEGNLQSIQDLESTLDLLSTEESRNDLGKDLSRAVKILSSGTSRCVSMQHKGFRNLGYDSHAANNIQTTNFEQLFSELLIFMNGVEVQHPDLYQRLTVVVLSEMGRYPKMNFRQGKTHWMHTSAILIGSGVRGDNVIGAYDDRCSSSPISLETGEVFAGGTLLKPEHLGATLLHLADVEPTDSLQTISPIWGAIQ